TRSTSRPTGRNTSPMTPSSSAVKRLSLSFLLLVLPFCCAAGEFGVNLYGASYHFERSRAKALGLDNEFNPGLGVRYRDKLAERWDWFIDAGAYRDSGRKTALDARPDVL